MKRLPHQPEMSNTFTQCVCVYCALTIYKKQRHIISLDAFPTFISHPRELAAGCGGKQEDIPIPVKALFSLSLLC